jgi:hypothetical protein
MDSVVPEGADAPGIDAFWTVTARSWLDELRIALGKPYSIYESDRFLMLSSQEPRPAKVTLDYVEKTRKRILRLLDGIAVESEMGKVCIIVLKDHDQYYEYVSNYHKDDGEYSLSGGMFLQYGYGHFVFVESKVNEIEPTIAHELTHCLLQHLPLPAWLNEGIAVNTEHRFCPPGRPLFDPEEMHAKHLNYWNASTIQEFWSGKSWRRTDDGNMLSYDLAKHFAVFTSEDAAAFRAFANRADMVDGGSAAALECLGYPLEHLAQAVLGEGPWQPKPESWGQGTERGQF